jgi:hypothetical protein
VFLDLGGTRKTVIKSELEELPEGLYWIGIKGSSDICKKLSDGRFMFMGDPHTWEAWQLEGYTGFILAEPPKEL